MFRPSTDASKHKKEFSASLSTPPNSSASDEEREREEKERRRAELKLRWVQILNTIVFVIQDWWQLTIRFFYKYSKIGSTDYHGLQVAACLDNFGRLLSIRSKYAKARSLLLTSLEMKQCMLGARFVWLSLYSGKLYWCTYTILVI